MKLANSAFLLLTVTASFLLYNAIPDSCLEEKNIDDCIY